MAFVIYTEKLQRAVDTVIAPGGYSVDQDPAPSGRSTLKESFAIGSGISGGGYNGYFKLSLANLSNGKLQVTIADGITGYDQYCRVNRLGYRIPRWTSEEYDVYGGIVYFCLKFTAEGDNVNGTVEIVAEKSLDLIGYSGAWYLLGRLIRPQSSDDGFSAYIVQDHCSSIPHILWFGGCY